MNNKSSEIFVFLLVTGCLLCAFVVEGDGNCNFNATVATCFGSRYNMNEPMKISRVFSFFNRTVSESCSRMDGVKKCIEGKTFNCEPERNNPLRKIWVLAEKGINYICREKQAVFETNRDCLKQQEMISSSAPCQDKLSKDHSAHRRYARHSCSQFHSAIRCVKEVVNSRCGSEAAVAVEHTVRIFLSMNDADHDCGESDSGASFGVSILMMAAAFLLSILH